MAIHSLTLQTYSYRFAEQVMNSNLSLRKQIEGIITDPSLPVTELSRPTFNKELDDRFQANGWEAQPVRKSKRLRNRSG